LGLKLCDLAGYTISTNFSHEQFINCSIAQTWILIALSGQLAYRPRSLISIR
jgi:hypothetical protein